MTRRDRKSAVLQRIRRFVSTTVVTVLIVALAVVAGPGAGEADARTNPLCQTSLAYLLGPLCPPTGPQPPAPQPPAPPVAPPTLPPGLPGVGPSGQPMPTADLPGWRHIFADDFTKDASTGSWANDCSPDKIAYTGAQGQKWRTYPRCWNDTYQKRPYRADAVLSVHSGMLDFHLRNVDGQPAGANPSPLITGTSQYQTYGRYSARIKVDRPGLREYHVAWLLWPQSESWPWDGEIDFPEASLADRPLGYHHYSGPEACAGGCQDVARDIGAKFTDWHTYTIEWSPGRVRMLIDDVVVLNSTRAVPSKPMRWQLQTETKGNGNANGHLLVDWVSVWAHRG